jgi:peptidoglycan/xylan/chitin deacetylase (PgdA/CDA1 family)
VYLKAICRLKNTKNSVVLTFDDGVDDVQTPKVLDVLKKYDSKAIFFLIGRNAQQHPQIVERIVAEGHEIGIHTYSHKSNFPLMSVSQIKEEIYKTQQILEKISKKQVNLFRPPFGVTNPNIAKAVKSLNLVTVGWSIRSYDTNLSKSRLEVANQVSKKLKGNDIILLHDNRQGAEVLLEELLKNIFNKGYKVVLL